MYQSRPWAVVYGYIIGSNTNSSAESVASLVFVPGQGKGRADSKEGPGNMGSDGTGLSLHCRNGYITKSSVQD